MFMSASSALPVATFVPDPAAPGEGRPSRFGRLLEVVRKLIDYGKELATNLQRRAATDADVTRPFGTRDIGLILARITRGLLRANALEARVVELAARPDAPAAPSRAPAQRAPGAPLGAPRPAAARPTAKADPRLALLPTPEQIAADVRRRPVGAVIADICRDLGIMPSHPLWRDLSLVIIRHGGSLAALVRDIMDRGWPIPGLGRSVVAPADVAGAGNRRDRAALNAGRSRSERSKRKWAADERECCFAFIRGAFCVFCVIASCLLLNEPKSRCKGIGNPQS